MKDLAQHSPPSSFLRGTLTAIACALAVGNANAQLQFGLVSYWDFENNFADTAGTYSTDSTFADDGTAGSAVILTPAGQLGTYGDFTRTEIGDDNVVKIPDSADLNATGESITISAWFKVTGFDQRWQAIIAHGEGSDWRISRRREEQGLSYAGGTGDIPAADITPNINDGAWHHIVSITEAGVSSRIWVNGVLISTSAAAANIGDNSSTEMFIGGNPQGNDTDTNANQYRAWNGGIDDVAIWNRPLTDAEISQIHTEGQNGNSLSTLFDNEDDDLDGLLNGWEDANGLDRDDDGSIDINNGPNGDPDGDGSNNLAEQTNKTDPQDPDTDDDFSNDGEEAANGTDPRDNDSDNDTLLDGYETNDGTYLSATVTGTDPNVSDLPLDTDLDGLLNIWEIENGLNPFDDGTTNAANGATGDPDSDNSDNLAEQTNSTDPQDPDSDDDFSEDGEEATNETDPLNPDSDSDSLLDGYETNNGLMSYLSPTDTGTDPKLLDTDADGTNDNFEIDLGTDPTDPNSKPAIGQLPIIDDFEDDVVNLTDWRTITRIVPQNDGGTIFSGSITETAGSLEIANRGYLYTAGQFDPETVGGIQIRGELTFGTDPDVFSVLTRSNIIPNRAYGEAQSGVQFVLSIDADTVLINARNEDHTVENSVITGDIDFVIGTPYLFTINDDGLGGLSMVVVDKNDPAITITITADLTFDASDSNHIAFYNREGGQQSSLQELAITTLAPAGPPEITDISYDITGGTGSGSFSLTWTSTLNQGYSIYSSTDLQNWDIEIADNILGQDGETTHPFNHPAPGTAQLFFRIEPPR